MLKKLLATYGPEHLAGGAAFCLVIWLVVTMFRSMPGQASDISADDQIKIFKTQLTDCGYHCPNGVQRFQGADRYNGVRCECR